MKQFKRVLRRDVLAICAVVFLADFVAGLLSPTFSIYAQRLGASLTLIGVLGSVVGFTRMFLSMPLGLLSDAHGRKLVISGGMLLFALSTFLYTLAPNPYWLLPMRILFGLAVTGTFFIGIAYLGDTVAREERGVAVGLYTTAMGLGFTVGPFVGGLIAAHFDIQTSYRVAALLALLGFFIARVGLNSPAPKAAPEERTGVEQRSNLTKKLTLLMRNPDLLAASVANMLMSIVFGGAIINFFPLYAASLGVGEAAIGSMFALRGLVSTCSRMPTGMLTVRASSRHLMTLALALAMLMAFAIAFTADARLVGLWLVGEGVAFGMFLTAGQAFVTEHAADTERGSAIGLYSTAGSVGGAAGPFVLGLAAEVWNLAAVFQITGVLVLIGIGVLWVLSARQQRVIMERG